jgi:hypothetical protein
VNIQADQAGICKINIYTTCLKSMHLSLILFTNNGSPVIGINLGSDIRNYERIIMNRIFKYGINLLLAGFAVVYTTAALAMSNNEEPTVQASPRSQTPIMLAEVVGREQPGMSRPYSRSLMSEAEMRRHTERMRNIRDLRERDAYRQRVHNELQSRAARKGINVPSSPPDWAYCAGSGCLGHGVIERDRSVEQLQRYQSGPRPQPTPDAIPINIP